MPQYKLTYFAIRGLAEPIRQIFHIGGIPYENVRVQFDEWAELKSKTPFGVLPILEVDGLQLSESNSIARYMAKEAGLYGKNNEEAALIDGIADLWTDYFNEIKPFRICLRTNDADEKVRRSKRLRSEVDDSPLTSRLDLLSLIREDSSVNPNLIKLLELLVGQFPAIEAIDPLVEDAAHLNLQVSQLTKENADLASQVTSLSLEIAELKSKLTPVLTSNPTTSPTDPIDVNMSTDEPRPSPPATLP